MIAVIQCAASKQPDAGYLRTANGLRVEFVANPQSAPLNGSCVYARPDDLSDNGTSWRRVLLTYNQKPGSNPLGLYRAYELYQNDAYSRLVQRLGLRNVFILSAGWGLIRADFLTPQYDITFRKSSNVPKFKRREKWEKYDDFRMLPDEGDEILFFGGKDYLPFFCSLTDAAQGERIAFFNSASVPRVAGCTLRRFETSTRTNWQYECVNAFLDGTLPKF